MGGPVRTCPCPDQRAMWRYPQVTVSALGGLPHRARDLQIRSHPCGHPDPFRSVRDLGRVPARCSRQSGELEGRSSAWLPAAHNTGHRDALVLVTNIGPSTGKGTTPCPAQTPPPNPIAAEPGDGRVLSRPSSRVHEPRNSPDAVALRQQTALTGSGSHRSSYGGFGGGHPHFHPHTGCGNPISPKLALSAWEVCGATARLPTDWLICGSTVPLTVKARDCPRWLLRSGT